MSAMMTNEQMLDYLVNAAKMTLDGPEAEHIPTLTVEDATGHTTLVALAGGHPYEVLMASYQAIRDMQPVRVTLSVDAYMSVVAHDELPAQYQGRLSAAFEAGDPRVSEAMQFSIVSHESEAFAFLKYKRTDTTIEWAEVERGDDRANHSGRMVDVLRMCLP